MNIDFDQQRIPVSLDPANDDDWKEIADLWSVREDTLYLNHGSFGITPKPIKAVRDQWQMRQDEQPMDFYVRQMEPAWENARDQLASFVNTMAENLVFVDNATIGMNVVADSFPLQTNDEVLLNDHEYGAVHRIWERSCNRQRAICNNVTLPEYFESPEQIVDSIFQQANDRTRLIVVSHITSATAIVMPVQQICDEAAKRGIAVCIDGPHALVQVPVDIDQLGCDFYTASCHKWLSAPLGTGFLAVSSKWHDLIQPQVKSWGRLLPAMPKAWFEEFIWSGTRNISSYLAIPAAIELFETIGVEQFRARSRYLMRTGQAMLCKQFGTTPLAEFEDAYASMTHVPLPEGNHTRLQERLWQRHGIEVPIIDFNHRWFIRVSNHLYNDMAGLEKLSAALADCA